MLKLKAAVPRASSLLHFFTGERGVAPLPFKLITLERSYATRSFSSFQLNGIESPKQSAEFLSESDEEDEFSELGRPLRQGRRIPKLMTEKREHFQLQKAVNTRQASSSSPVPLDIKKTLMDALLKAEQAAAPQVKHKKKSDIFEPSPGNKTGSSLKSTSVTIVNVPSIIELPELKEAMSSFGNISNASMRPVPNGLDCCDIEFESVGSKSKALSVGRITVCNFNLSIRPLGPQTIVTIRIGNISPATAKSAIHSLCMSCGSFEGLARTKEDSVDALFSVESKSDRQGILRKLNNTTMDGSKWHANPLTTPSLPQPTADENAKLHSGLKVIGHLKDLERYNTALRVCAQDLENLHQSILHLEYNPVTASSNLSSTD
ncbi:hypothetical protein Tsubulata_004241 [Turnera subulata]|uniref:RRM domain-containing protein n=1 Tax=Turnera subulata TaxID=218843 RepID=A0A9Q0JEH0_9ROSI|nr:hypothetical protein Tsubulata_004241 [Turnera subulata]